MARRTVVQFTSDLSGDAIQGDATVQFGLDDATYEIDLTEREQKELRHALAPYIAAGRKVRSTGRRRTTTASAASKEPTPKEIRDWAVQNGHAVPARGRMPLAAMEAYKAAH